MKEPIFLSLDEILEIHEQQIKLYGGHPGILNIEILKSAIATPAASFGGEYLYSDIFEMAAAYLFHIVRNHPFVDGNKRTGALSSIVFLWLNGIEIQSDEDSFERMVLSVAESKSGKAEIANFFRDNSAPR